MSNYFEEHVSIDTSLADRQTAKVYNWSIHEYAVDILQQILPVC